MGGTIGGQKFSITDDGTIVRGRICPNCGKELISEGEYCEYCGAKIRGGLSQNNGSKKWVLWMVFFITVAVVVSIVLIVSNKQEKTIRKVEVPDCYIDLGLPSGTLWKSLNEEGYYYYEKADSIFGCQLPTKKQWMELMRCCEWTWGRNGSSNGYYVKGKNNCYIFLPAENLLVEGWIPDNEYIKETLVYYEYDYLDNKESCESDFSSDTEDLEFCGSYICSDIEGFAPWIFSFDDEMIGGNYDPIEYCGVWHSVRLVKDN